MHAFFVGKQGGKTSVDAPIINKNGGYSAEGLKAEKDAYTAKVDVADTLRCTNNSFYRMKSVEKQLVRDYSIIYQQLLLAIQIKIMSLISLMH